MHAPILPVSTMVERRTDVVVILAWNFKDEIIAQNQDFIAGGGRFLVAGAVARVRLIAT